ncbi:MAG TPA: hypothetical protein VHD62_15700 [Opitutaceae bacterium]|nr:hypothetical protein [Opitutaceae bacterium]
MSDHSPGVRGSTRFYGGIGVAALVALAVYTLTRTRAPFYDEVYHLAHAADWFSAGSLRAWLTKASASAVGPFYGLFYQRFIGAHGWPVPWIRGPNLFFLAYTIAVLGAAGRRYSGVAALGVMAVPMTWVIAGMALTEMPAAAMLATAVYAAGELARDGEREWRWRAVWWAVLGVAFGIAVAVRQSVLIVAPALLLLAAKRRVDWMAGAAVLVAGLAPMLVVFWIWRGLLPPGQEHVGGAFSIAHALFGFAYVGLAALLLAPEWWWSGRKLALGAGAVAIVFNALIASPPLTMLSSVLRALGPTLAPVAERMLAAATIATGGAFIGLLVREARRCDTRARGLILGTALVCLSCGAIAHQFSSRYVTLALPFCVPLLAPRMTFGPWAAARLAGGAVVGFAVLRSYYNFPG